MKKIILLHIITLLSLSSCSFFNKKPEKRNEKTTKEASKKGATKKDSIVFSNDQASNIIQSFIKLKGKDAQLVASWKELITVADLVKQVDKQDLVTIDVFAEENYQAVRKLLKAKIPKPLDKATVRSRISLLEMLSNKLARKTLRFDNKKQALEDAKAIGTAFNQLVANIKYELEEHLDFAKDLEKINKYSEQHD